MENVKENEIDLRLALGVAHERVSNRDAGANASSRSRRDALLGHRPLPELVWSTQNGLSIKCGGCSRCSAGTKPCVLSDEKCMFEESVKSPLGPSVGHDAVESKGEVKCVEMETHNKQKGKECMNIPVGNATGTSEGNIGSTQGIREIASGGLEKVEETAENDVFAKELENVGEDSSGESLGSSNSASKKNKRRGFEHEFISTSKRLKKQSQECGVVRKQDSSFMNWISNMVKPYQQDDDHDHDHPADDRTLNSVVSKMFGFRSVFQSLYTQRLEETITQRESSKETILFDRQQSPDDDSLNQKAFPKPPSTLLATKNNSNHKPTASASTSAPTSASAGCKKPVAVTSSYEVDALKRTMPMASRTCFFCGKTGHETRDCLHINENKNLILKKKVKISNINQISENDKSMDQDKICRIPKEIFDTIKRLRLSRTDILKWMNSGSKVGTLEGYFLRLRLSKWEEGVGGAGYYVACITDETPSKGFKQPIRVSIGGVQCLVECQYISNCDFREDELVAWWLKSGGALTKEDLTFKLEEKKKLGLSLLL